MLLSPLHHSGTSSPIAHHPSPLSIYQLPTNRRIPWIPRHPLNLSSMKRKRPAPLGVLEFTSALNGEDPQSILQKLRDFV